MKTYSNDEIKDIRKKKEKKSNIIRIIIMALLIVLEIIFILLLINKTQFKNDEIGLFGGKVYIINDNSMNPELNRDDIIILKGVNEGINEQDIITYYDNISQRHMSKRVVEIRTVQDGSYKYIVQGNLTDDKSDVLDNQIEGVYKAKVAFVGKLFRLSPTVNIICIAIVLVILFCVWNGKNRKEERAFSRHEIRKEYEKKHYNSEE